MNSVPAWDKMPFTTSDIVNTLSALHITTGQINDINLLGNFSGTIKWVGCVNAPNGCVYGMPFNKSTVLKINISNDNISELETGDNSTWKWAGGVLALNGNIYGIPYRNADILKINPNTDVITTFGNTGAGINKWNGGILAQNGYIYCSPDCAASILKIDPSNDSFTTFGTFASSEDSDIPGFAKWGTAILAPNGYIYAIPLLWTEVLKINPADDSYTTFGTFGAGFKWFCGVALSNGIIYCMPYNNPNIMKIDTNTDTISYIVTGLPGGGGSEYYGGCVLGADGFIYGIPYSAHNILKINPYDDTFTTFGVLPDSYQYYGAVLAPNGSIYAVPQGDATKVLKVLSQYNLDPNICLSRLTNKM